MGMSTSENRYVGAQAVAIVFKVLALLVLVGGVISTDELHKNLVSNYATTGTATFWSLVSFLGTVIVAAGLGFFAYVLDILRGIYAEAVLTTNQLVAEPPMTSADLKRIKTSISGEMK